MGNYRIYCYGGGERLWADDRLGVVDDEQAVALARTIAGVIKAEVWQGARLVASLDKSRAL